MSTDHQNSTSLKYSLLGSFSKWEMPEDWDVDDYKLKISKLTAYDIQDCAFQAAISGNVRLLRLLYQEKGPIQVDYENTAPNLTRHTLNGTTYQMNGIKPLKDLTSVEDFKDLLRAIKEFEIKGLSEPGETAPALFEKIDHNDVVENLAVRRFSGELPELSGGLLKNPELALALQQESESNPHSAAYQPIFCWATPDMVESFGDFLAPLTPYQEVGSLTRTRHRMAEFKARAGNKDNMLFDTVVTGLFPSSRTTYAPLLMKSLCPLASFFGFDDSKGRILCETKADFLLTFDTSGVTPENTELAKSFAKTYCPIEIIATNARNACLRDFGYGGKKLFYMNACLAQDHYSHQGFNGLFGLLANNHPLQAQAKEMMEVGQWKALLSKADQSKLKASSLVAMSQAFGIDNTGLQLTVTAGEIDVYLDAGFKFSSQSNFFDSDSRFKAHLNEHLVTGTTAVYARFSASSLRDRKVISGPDADLLEMATKDFSDVVLKLNIWPSESERPKDLADALKMAGPLELSRNTIGNNRAMSLRAILADAGIEACAKVAKTPRAWLKLTEVFPRDEIEPYIKQMPREAKGKLLEQDLGM